LENFGDQNLTGVRDVDGITDDKVIADNFARHFEKGCAPFSRTRNDDFASYLNKIYVKTNHSLLQSSSFQLN